MLEHVTYEPQLDSWVCWDNNEATADEVKRLYPTDHVMLFDREKGTYSDYTIEKQIPKPIIKAGRLVFPDEEMIEV